MTLVFDRREQFVGQPMTHALLIGVSEYTQLPAYNEPPNPETFNLKRLASCALSAWEICRWLEANKDSLVCPLGTIRLLMSPSELEKSAFESIKASREGWLNLEPSGVDAADWTHFVPEALAWRTDTARANKKGTSFFYYSGHGLRRNGSDLITLADFGDPLAGGRLLRSFELVSNFVMGMAPTDDRRDMARNQFYFVDCCREDIVDSAYPGTVWGTLSGRDDRATPVFMASYPGAVAMAIRGKPTDFCHALLKCLPIGTDAATPDDQWIVTSFSLNRALEAYFTKLGTGQYAPGTGISFRDVPLHRLPGPPPVEFNLVIKPSNAVGGTTVSLRHTDGLFDGQFPAAASEHPYEVHSFAGIHEILATPSGAFKPYSKLKPIVPFWTELPIDLIPNPPQPPESV
ncbi:MULTISPECIES: caspase family protein [unclassified Ensifer]|uniref:caspase family protein n=1 Tax=unclassified Ensifer TaxID=2633371 RepID=UPI00070B1F4D|nr:MULTISPECIES: caspase family protein [unclassified Ensifer]KQW43170.1 hypothetical protein ASD02_35405 [Ensifer sp. Root1252]KRC67108.1 hypothetical protein ASE32_35635 [Ensifer sp. Root231]KRC93687.1 hypothetical protein ASE47_35490 [Ensifer sp. Root258]